MHLLLLFHVVLSCIHAHFQLLGVIVSEVWDCGIVFRHDG